MVRYGHYKLKQTTWQSEVLSTRSKGLIDEVEVEVERCNQKKKALKILLLKAKENIDWLASKSKFLEGANAMTKWDMVTWDAEPRANLEEVVEAPLGSGFDHRAVLKAVVQGSAANNLNQGIVGRRNNQRV